MKHGHVYNLIVLLLFAVTSLNAINKVTVASIAAEKPYFGENQDPQKMVELMIEFYGEEFKKVLPHQPDLIVLTEACDRPSGLSYEEQYSYYRVRKNQVSDYFARVAKENSCYIAFGTKWVAADGNWRNSCIVLDRQGEVAGMYHKNFPTIGEMERGIVPGTETPLIECDFGSLACAICFDLNFDELRREYEKLKPDIIVFPSMYHGGPVQNYWAYSCRSFFIASCGFEDLPSEIRNPLGEVIASTSNYFHTVSTSINLDCRLVHLDNNWGKLRKVKEKYGAAVIITDPGKLGAVLLSSEHENITADQMIEEFEIELLDDYFGRSRAVRNERINDSAQRAGSNNPAP